MILSTNSGFILWRESQGIGSNSVNETACRGLDGSHLGTHPTGDYARITSSYV